MSISNLNNILETIYNLKISRVWRGYGKVIFLEFGDLTDDKGEYSLWIDVSTWKLVDSSSTFDASNEEYETIDQYITQLKGQAVTKISFDANTKILEATFSSNTKLVCIPEVGHTIDIIKNDEKLYLTFEADGSVKIDNYRPAKSEH